LTDLPKVDESAFAAIDGLIAPPIFLKLEGGNPAGSVKYKTALGLLDAAERDGSLRRDSILIESSSRSAGVALAMLCAPLVTTARLLSWSGSNRTQACVLTIIKSTI